MRHFSPAKTRLALLTIATTLGLALITFGTTPGVAQAPVSVRLGYFPNVTHAQALIGVKRGDFQKALGTTKLETSTYNAGPSVIEAVFAGHLDIAYVGPSPIINGFIQSRGEEVRIVAGAATNGVLIIGNKKRNITALDQLKGKRIASPQLGNTQDISAKDFVLEHLKTTLKERGGSTEVVPIANSDIENLFAKDQLDAAWVPEPWGSRIISKGFAVLIAEEKDLWPKKEFALTNIIARREFLEKHPDLVQKVLEAHIRLTQELKADPSALAELLNAELKRLTSKDLPPDVLASSLKYTGFTVEPNPESIQKFFEMGKTLRLVRGDKLDLQQLMKLEPLRAAQKATGSASTATSATATAP